MIDITKQYETVEGNEVKLSFIENGKAYGHYKHSEGAWSPGRWIVDTGKAVEYATSSFNSLVEKRESKDVFLKVWIYEGGLPSFKQPEDDMNHFGSIEIYTTLKQGENKIIKG